MRQFLNVIPVSDAINTIRRLALKGFEEEVPIDDALHRVLAEDVRSDVDIPGFTRSVVDGYAVRAADTVGSSESIPAILALKGRIAMGAGTDVSISTGECMYIPTGGLLPGGADAAVMVEQTEAIGDETLIKKPVAAGENIILFNEDFSKGGIVLPQGRRLSPQDIGVLAAAGCRTVPVIRKPRVAVISTGNELVPVEREPGPGQVRDVNSYVVTAFVRDQGCTPVMYGIVRDDRDALRSALAKAASECDVVLISGGSSKDDRDMVAAVIGEEGEVLIHGIAIAPGKPTIIGRTGNVPVIGLPGHPASAFVVLVVVVRYLLNDMAGESGTVQVPVIEATLSENIPSTRGREDYIRVVVRDGVATPLFGKSGLLNTLVRSTGMVRVPAGSEGLETGTRVEVILW
ncbi:gephyrin-like molybdotransferase Glp [uncultured Methanoregula sp.]|uniref:molybdopterin molybdotransferase MoeA n=1 Tax=uncultured Methanoregula sp. TaxID=1005933 RepID=UPI002AAA8737|nr:gephyrin-like molybdotransferase Glp [uncultured Methanoregula sp.]